MAKVAILQRVVTNYRYPLFSKLMDSNTNDYIVYYGDDLPNSKVRSFQTNFGLCFVRLRTKFIRLNGHIFPYHFGLLKALRQSRPDIIICEGDSHFLGYIIALIYKFIFNKSVKLVFWCFLVLPGEDISSLTYIMRLRYKIRSIFDAYLLYSSYSKNGLKFLPEKRNFVVTNVGNVEKFCEIANSIDGDSEILRRKLNLRSGFTVLYLGTLDRDKKPEVLLEIAYLLRDEVNFLFLGGGELFDGMNKFISRYNLYNVHLAGRITDNIGDYIKACDVCVIPGRGGIVISEAMSFSLPVVVNMCDGTEYDLVRNGENGFIVSEPLRDNLLKKISFLQQNSSTTKKFGDLSRKMVEDEFNIGTMVLGIESMVESLCKNPYH
jgi:glycosyltransferase involved in cell wall biosynthesis